MNALAQRASDKPRRNLAGGSVWPVYVRLENGSHLGPKACLHAVVAFIVEPPTKRGTCHGGAAVTRPRGRSHLHTAPDAARRDVRAFQEACFHLVMETALRYCARYLRHGAVPRCPSVWRGCSPPLTGTWSAGIELLLPSRGHTVLFYPRLVMASYDIPERTKSVATRNGDSLLAVPVATDAALLHFATLGKPPSVVGAV